MANSPRIEHQVAPKSEEDRGEALEAMDLAAPPTAEAADEADEPEPRNRVQELLAKFRKPAQSSRDQKAGDRARGAVILAGAAIGCLFLFFGVFTTTTDPSKQERRTQPSLGRPQGSEKQAEPANRSVVPQLNVTQQPNDETGELTEKDLLGTMRNRGTSVPPQTPSKPVPPQSVGKRPMLSSVNFEDPALAEAYRRQGLTPPPQRPEVADWNLPKPSPAAAPVVNPSDGLRKSSFAFVRSSLGTGAGASNVAPTLHSTRTANLLPKGTKLVARLQFTVSSAARVPVVAVIEYNYERDGELIVPAGTKAYGTLSQATPQGWVSIKFEGLEFPNGDQEKINGSALGMDQGILRGFVDGRNTGKKFLTRTLTGIGTIAAFAVGGRGLGGQVDNSVLLRERLSSNVAMAGEQELAMLAYQQNIVVTIPANTRFLLVLNEPEMNGRARRVAQGPGSTITTSSPETRTATGMSQRELQELISIRNEMREMSRLIKVTNSSIGASPETEK